MRCGHALVYILYMCYWQFAKLTNACKENKHSDTNRKWMSQLEGRLLLADKHTPPSGSVEQQYAAKGTCSPDGNPALLCLLLIVIVAITNNFLHFTLYSSTLFTVRTLFCCITTCIISHAELQTFAHMIINIVCRNICVQVHDCRILSCVGGTFLKFHNLNILMRIKSTRAYYS